MANVAMSFEGDTEIEEKNMKQDELLDWFTSVIQEKTEDQTILDIQSKLDCTLAQAVNRFRKLKSDAGLTQKKGERGEQVRAFVKEKHDEGLIRADIVSALQDQFEYSAKSAASTYSQAAKALGIISAETSRKRVDAAEIIRIILENSDKPDKELIEILKDATGYAQSTCRLYVSMVPFAKAWCDAVTI